MRPLQAGGFHAGDELRCDVEDAVRDGLLQVLHLEALLFELGDVLGRYALNFAGDQIFCAGFPKSELAHRASVLGRDVLNLHGNHVVQIDVVARGFHAIDVANAGLRRIVGLVLRLRLGICGERGRGCRRCGLEERTG